MKRIYKRHTAFAAVLTACCLCGGGLHAAAITVDDVAQKAREVGFPEEQVQLGYNYWATGEYTEKDLEEAYARLCEYDQQADDKIDDIFNNGGTVQPSQPAQTQPAQTQPATQPPAQTDAAQTQPATQTPANSGTAAGTTAPAETQPASTTISSYDFIMMSLDEKIAYVNSMSPADKEAFLNNLTPGERNSIIKQMNVNDQAELLQGYIDAAKEMNMNIAVDSISAEGIAITVRDDEGTIIDKSATGITIDETGIAHDGLLAAAAIAVLLAAAGFALVYRHLCRTDGGVQ
ncbi:MAG: hypothetical protein E7502_02355 [Ruminococcus sp.]|nr:hypothetical protein [Ruminococcus sp.]